MIRWAALAPAALCACGFDPSGEAAARAGDASFAPGDAAPDASGRHDGGPLEPLHLLLTEVKTGPMASEFIEIYNPSCTPVDLSTVYLTDAPGYPLLPSWGEAPPALAHQDAVLRFPDGAVLDARSVAVIARHETTFIAGYTDPPDFAVLGAALAGEMVLVARGDTVDIELVNEGEMVALFTWDGAGDLVQDLDIVIAGDVPAADDDLDAKQTVAPAGVDGPDADAIATAYRDDAATLPAAAQRDAGASAALGAYQRVATEDGHEVEADANGLLGHDETSEDTLATWEQDEGTAPTPGAVPDALRTPCVGP